MKKIYSLFALTLFAGSMVAQVTLVKDIKLGSSNSSPTELTVYDGYIYFKADYAYDANNNGSIDSDEDFGKEVIKSDGTADGTVVLTDLKANSGDSNPNGFFEYNNHLYFNANPGTYAPYRTDGTTTESVASGYGILGATILNGTCYYRHTYTVDDIKNQLFQYDGTDFSAVALSEGTAEEYLYNIIAFDNKIFAYMYWGDDKDIVGKELYAYDPSATSWELIANIGEDDITTDPSNPTITDASISEFTIIDNKLYFEAMDALWVTDGTTDGTMAVSVASAITGVKTFYAWDGKLFFEGDNSTDGDQLYVYNPSAGTVTNLSNLSGTDHDPSDFCAFNGFLYYSGYSANGTDKYLFRTDGTTIEQLDDVVTAIDDIVVLNGVLYFEGEDKSGTESTGKELFSFDPSNIPSSVNTTYSSTICLYPNPTNGILNIKGLENTEAEYKVYDISGRIVQSGVTSGQVTLTVSTGIFIIELKDGNKVSTTKVHVK